MFAVSFLGTSYSLVVTVCAELTVPSTALITLILESLLSTLRTWTLSVPIPKRSFSLIAG